MVQARPACRCRLRHHRAVGRVIGNPLRQTLGAMTIVPFIAATQGRPRQICRKIAVLLDLHNRDDGREPDLLQQTRSGSTAFRLDLYLAHRRLRFRCLSVLSVSLMVNCEHKQHLQDGRRLASIKPRRRQQWRRRRPVGLLVADCVRYRPLLFGAYTHNARQPTLIRVRELVVCYPWCSLYLP
jgi:hypothetical protein